jgi:hypothetical protein
LRNQNRNLAHTLESAGSGLDRIVKMTVVLAGNVRIGRINPRESPLPVALY